MNTYTGHSAVTYGSAAAATTGTTTISNKKESVSAETLLSTLEVSIKAQGKNGVVQIGADALHQIVRELITLRMSPPGREIAYSFDPAIRPHSPARIDVGMVADISSPHPHLST